MLTSYVLGKRDSTLEYYNWDWTILSGCYLELPGMVNSGCAVNMTLSSLGIKLTSIESGRVISTHDMQGISFASGGEKVSWYFKPLKLF